MSSQWVIRTTIKIDDDDGNDGVVGIGGCGDDSDDGGKVAFSS